MNSHGQVRWCDLGNSHGQVHWCDLGNSHGQRQRGDLDDEKQMSAGPNQICILFKSILLYEQIQAKYSIYSGRYRAAFVKQRAPQAIPWQSPPSSRNQVYFHQQSAPKIHSTVQHSPAVLYLPSPAVLCPRSPAIFALDSFTSTPAILHPPSSSHLMRSATFTSNGSPYATSSGRLFCARRLGSFLVNGLRVPDLRSKETDVHEGKNMTFVQDMRWIRDDAEERRCDGIWVMYMRGESQCIGEILRWTRGLSCTSDHSMILCRFPRSGSAFFGDLSSIHPLSSFLH